MDFSKLKGYMDSLETKYGVPGTELIVTKGNETVFHKLTGFRDYDKSAETNENDLYRLYSASKVITNVAILQLYEAGKLDLYDPLKKYLPEFALMRVAADFHNAAPGRWPDENTLSRFAHQQIRIIDLMTMTAGMSYDTGAKVLMEARKSNDPKMGTREVVALMAQMPLIYEPGTQWAYSLAHDVLAAVVEVVSGQLFGEYLKEHITAPLGVEQLWFHLDAENEKRLSALYMWNMKNDQVERDNGVVSSSFTFTPSYESGGAGMIATAKTYSAIMEALSNMGIGRNGARILKENTVKLMTVGYLNESMETDYRVTGKRGYTYGLGVRVRKESMGVSSPAGEFGWDGAAGAYSLVDCQNHVSIFYAQHVMGLFAAYDLIHPTIRDLVYEGLSK